MYGYAYFSKCLFYADDVKLYTCVNNKPDSKVLQGDQNNVIKWYFINKMELN